MEMESEPDDDISLSRKSEKYVTDYIYYISLKREEI